MTDACDDGAAETGAYDEVVLSAADAEEARYEHLHGRQAWDARYSEHAGGHHHGGMWSGDANAVLVAETEDLDSGPASDPATAFDAGAGEGADALWLAGRGWKVTAADLSPVALERGRSAAQDKELDVEWRQTDLTRDPAPGTYDLVTAMYLHIPSARRARLFAHLADAVTPGGTLLIVGHDPSDADSGVHRPDLADIGWTAEQAAASVPDGWTVETCEARPRAETAPDGTEATVYDAVMRARRG